MIPWPFCEVLDLLEPFKKRNEEQAFGLTARLNKPGDPPLYYQNENFIVEVKTPAKFESYVYVDYYSTDETVGHLFPNAKETSNRLGPNRSYTVGQLNGPQPWSSFTTLRARPRDGDRQQSAAFFAAKACIGAGENIPARPSPGTATRCLDGRHRGDILLHSNSRPAIRLTPWEVRALRRGSDGCARG